MDGQTDILSHDIIQADDENEMEMAMSRLHMLYTLDFFPDSCFSSDPGLH